MSPPGHTVTEPRVEQISVQRDARNTDASRFVREEFGPWLRRRGDLLIVRSKAKREWSVSSG